MRMEITDHKNPDKDIFFAKQPLDFPTCRVNSQLKRLFWCSFFLEAPVDTLSFFASSILILHESGELRVFLGLSETPNQRR